MAGYFSAITDNHKQTKDYEWKHSNKILLPDLVGEWHDDQKYDDDQCQEMTEIPFSGFHSLNVCPDDIKESNEPRRAENPKDKLFKEIIVQDSANETVHQPHRSAPCLLHCDQGSLNREEKVRQR